MACWASPSSIICWKIRRCGSEKKSSGFSFSIAAFSAWLSSRIAPSTLRSASRFCGSGRSRVTSGAIYVRLVFAIVNHLRSSADAAQGQRGSNAIAKTRCVGEIFLREARLWARVRGCQCGNLGGGAKLSKKYIFNFFFDFLSPSPLRSDLEIPRRRLLGMTTVFHVCSSHPYSPVAQQ